LHNDIWHAACFLQQVPARFVLRLADSSTPVKEIAMTPQVKLIVKSDKSKDITYTYNEPSECTVGRAIDCDIQLPVTEEKDVSRHHCLFEIEPPYLWVQDLDSTNGTFVNDLRITNAPDQRMYELREGDEVRVGHHVIEVQVEGTEILDDLKYSAFSNVAWAP